jgi:hypothetical protein
VNGARTQDHFEKLPPGDLECGILKHFGQSRKFLSIAFLGGDEAGDDQQFHVGADLDASQSGREPLLIPFSRPFSCLVKNSIQGR